LQYMCTVYYMREILKTIISCRYEIIGLYDTQKHEVMLFPKDEMGHVKKQALYYKVILNSRSPQ